MKFSCVCIFFIRLIFKLFFNIFPSCLPSQYQASQTNHPTQTRSRNWRKNYGTSSNANLRSNSHSIHDISSVPNGAAAQAQAHQQQAYSSAKPLETVIDNIISPYNEPNMTSLGSNTRMNDKK